VGAQGIGFKSAGFPVRKPGEAQYLLPQRQHHNSENTRMTLFLTVSFDPNGCLNTHACANTVSHLAEGKPTLFIYQVIIGM
jgi:hypothetical protein